MVNVGYKASPKGLALIWGKAPGRLCRQAVPEGNDLQKPGSRGLRGPHVKAWPKSG